MKRPLGTGNPLLEILSLYGQSVVLLPTTFHINSTPKCTIISVSTATDRPRYECIKLVRRPARPKGCAGSIRGAEETCRRAWLAEDGHGGGRSKEGKWEGGFM